MFWDRPEVPHANSTDFTWPHAGNIMAGMSHHLWTEGDRYITGHLIPPDPALLGALASNAAAALPPYDVAPNQGKLLYLLARIQGARRILEIGTLGGYSAIWLARALPAGGKLVTLELDSRHAQVALANLEAAGLASSVDLRIGPAAESLLQLRSENAAPFDLIFIDADKPNNSEYLRLSLYLSRVGTVIVTDNVVRGGAILDPHSPDLSVQGSRRLFEALAAEDCIDATAIQTVGEKGHDGFILAVVTKLPF